MRQNTHLTILLVLPLFLSGCLTPVKNEIPLAKSDLSVKATSTNDTKLVIFNDSSVLGFGVDGSGRINIKLNGKGLAQLNIGRYAQVIVPKGKYEVDLVHFDLVHFSSHHQIELNNPESYLMIYATPTSNQADMLSTLPQDFGKRFKPVK